MAELYAKPFEVVDTGYNPQQTPQGGQQSDLNSYLSTLPPEERDAAIQRINAPLTGEELAMMASTGQKMPNLEEYAEIEKYHKTQEVSFIDGLGKIAEGGEQVMTDLSNAVGSFFSNPADATGKMPATAVEAFAQGTRNFYGMLAESQNTDSVLFKVKDFLNGTGSLEDRYNQYLEALKFNKDSAELAEGKQTLIMDKDMINHEVTQAMAYIADPTLFIPFGKVASTGLRAVGLGEKLAMAGARSAAIKNGIIGNTLKWGAGQPLEFLGGAVRNTIDYGVEKAGQAFEATTGISGKEFAQTARMSGVGFSASGIAGHAVPYASSISDAYIAGSAARGFGEALTLMGETMAKNKFGRGINSWAAEALEQAEKNGVALSPHAKGLLKTLNAVDPLFAYGWNGLETAAEGGLIGGGLGYLSGNAEGMYSGIGAGIALGAVGGTAGKLVADVTGGTNIARRAVQAKMVIEGHKTTNPEKAMFFQAMQKAAEVRGQDVDLVNGIIAGIDKVAPNFEFHALTPDQFAVEAIKKGYDPNTGKFIEASALDIEFGGDRASKSKAMYILRSIGGEFAGNRKAFEEALKKHGKVFTPEEVQQLTRQHIVSARARQLLMRYGFVDPKGAKSDWSAIDTPAQKKFLDNLLKGLSPEEREAVKKQYENINTFDAQKEFVKSVDLSRDDLIDITSNKNRRSSKYNQTIDSFNRLTKTQQEAVLKEIDGQGEIAQQLGGTTKLREYYDALTWSEAWTDSLVKKFESNREGARKDIADMLAQETDKKGKLTSKGRALADKLRAEGFLDRDNKLLRERNLLQADLTYNQFRYSKGAVVGREADGKTHMYINLATMGSETFPHELFHTIMRESPMKKHFTDSLIQKLLGTVDKDGKITRPAEVNLGQVKKFFKKYIDLTHRKDDGTLDVEAAEAVFKNVEDALGEYQAAGENKKISDKARSLLENYSEEFGAYYFSHWLMGRNRNTLFFGGELKGIEGLVERTKDSFKDFWQSKISKSNPTFDFSKGLNESFSRSGQLGRIASVDYYMRDMVRAAANANKEVFRPDSMTLDNLRDFERSNGLRNLTTPDGSRRLNPREQVTQNVRLGKEAYKILSGLDKTLRTSKDVIDENGKQIITGRLSEAELDALVKGGIVPRGWADKVNQGYAMLDGTISNIFSAGYLGRTEQTTDASYPRLTGKDVAFKNRKAVLFDVETKIKADGTFYTLFHTLDLAVIEQRGNHLWQNTDYNKLWNGDRAAFEADFFKYISNASKASTDVSKQDSATLFETGDGNGSKRRDVLHQMAGMAIQTGDAYKHQPIAVIPEGIRHSVTTFNIDGMTTPRVETGARYDINMGNAHKFIRENWQPVDMVQEKTPSGVIMKHDSGFKFVRDASGSVSAYSPNGDRIGKFGSIREATVAAKNKFHKVHDNFDADLKKQQSEQDGKVAKLQALEVSEREDAIRSGDLFSLQKVKDFIGNRKVLRQTREEFIVSKAHEALNDPSLIEKAANDVINKNKQVLDEYSDVRTNTDTIENELTALKEQERELLDIFTRTADLGERNIIGAQADAIKTKRVKLTDDLRKNLDRKDKLREELKKTRIETFADYYWLNKGKPKTFIEALRSSIEQGIGATPWDTANANRGRLNGRKVGDNLPRKAHSGLQESLFAGEFDSQMKTGEPIVVIGTHGTRNVELMLSRILLDDKLGSRYGVAAGGSAHSADLGHFMGGSTDTSAAYADAVNRYFLQNGISVDEIRNYIGGRWEEGRTLAFSVAKFQEHLQQIRNKQLERVDAIASQLYGLAEGSENLGFKEKSRLHLEALAILDFQKTKKYIGDMYYEKIYSRLEDAYGNSQFPEKNGLSPSFENDVLYRDFGRVVRETMTDDVSIQYGFRIDSKQLVGLNAKVPFDLIQFADTSIGVKYDEGLYNAVISDARDLIKNLSTDENYAGGSDRTKFFKNLEISEEGRKYYEEQRAAGVREDDLLLPKQQLRMMMAFDNPKVIIDPRGYDERKLAPQMIQAINEGHDGVIFKRLADGGAMDDIYIQLKGNQDKILTIDSAFDPHHIPRKDENGNTLKTGRDLKLSLQPNELNAQGEVKGIQLDMTKAYDVFRQEYEQSTGQAWTKDKFMQRAKGWQFFGDENGFVAVRPQRSGFVKLVGMAGDNKSKIRAIQQIKELQLPVWGMVSEDIKNIAVRRGMREPNFFERTALKYALNSAALGDAQILGYTSDGGVRLKYPDIGEVTKYMIGSPEYYQKLRSQFGEQVKNKIGFQPDEVSQGGRKYDPASKEFRTKFIGKWAEENPDRLTGYNIEFIDRGGAGGYRNPNAQNVRIRMQDNSKKGNTIDVGHITAQIDHRGKTGEGIATISSNIAPEYRGNKLSYALYSEMAERLRSMGVKYVDGQIVNPEGIPIRVREKIIGNTLMLGADGSIQKARPISQEQGKKIIQRRQARGGEFDGIDVVNELDFNARYQPTDYQGGDDYYKPKKNIFESKDDRGLLVRRISVGNDELTGNKEARGSKTNPDYVGWEDIGHYPQTGETKADNLWEAKNSGLWYWKNDKGIKTKNPMWETDNPAFTHADWFDRSFQYEDDKPTIYGRYEKPKYDKDGNLTEKGRISISSNYRGEVKNMADANFYKETVASTLGVPPDHIDAYLFGANDKVKSQMGYGLKDQLAIKFQPTEGINAPVNKENRRFILSTIKKNDNSLRAFEEGQKNPLQRSQNYITVDNINPELLRGEAVVMHSPDNAGVEPVKIGRFTVNPRGGVRYPSENPTQGWAGVKAGLGKQINDNGNRNADKGYGWASAVGLIKGENSKMKGTHIGLEVFLRNLQNLTDKNVLTESQTIEILKNGLGDIGDTNLSLDTIVEGILAKSAKHEGKYTIDGRRVAVEKMTEAGKSPSLWSYLKTGQRNIEPHIEGFSSEGITTGEDFKKALLEPMYEAVSDPLTRHAKVGEVYGYLVFRSEVEEPKSNIHPSYKYSVQPVKGGSPVQLDILSTPMDARTAFKNRITAGEVSPLPVTDEGFKVSTGQKHIPTMRGTFQPAEYTQFKTEQSATGRIMRNAKGYVITMANNKFRVYNPTKVLLGVYGSEEESMKRIYREMPKQ